MAKFAVFSDTHLNNYKQYDKDGSRLDNSLESIRDIFKHCDKHGIDLILFTGDLYHLHKYIPTQVVNKTITLFDEVFNEFENIQFLAINGNHDYDSKNLAGRNSAEGALNHLQTVFKNFWVIDNDFVQNTMIGTAGLTVHGIPYYDYKEDFKTVLTNTKNNITQNNFNVLMIHQTPDGLIDFPIPSDCDPVKDFTEFDLVLCGHIHTRRKMSNNFWLVGSNLAQNFSDPIEDRGFMVFDVKKGVEPKVEFIKLDYPKFLTVREKDKDKYPNDYLKILPNLEDIAIEVKLTDVEAKFEVSTGKGELLKNYAEATGLSNDILAMGLKFLK
jgi:DNA repair exonuclease SbcCD nuclease subunit